jgi:pimeloyl-ACP methyl ester carboxylesterase
MGRTNDIIKERSRSASIFSQIVASSAAILLAACSSVPNASSVTTMPDKPPTDFYYPTKDALDEVAPGQVMAKLEIRAPAGMRAWTVLYGSIGWDGTIVAVSGVVLAPAGRSTAGGYPIVAFAHGTTGMADECAPSRSGLDAIPAQVLGLVKLGYVVSATDYQGLGTAGTHPYIVGVAEGRSVLDSILATRNLGDAHATDEAVIIGHSEGAYAALWAGQLAPTYARQINLRGLLAASPPIDLMALDKAAFDAASEGNWAAAIGVLRVYGVWGELYRLPLDFLTNEGRQTVIAELADCSGFVPSANPYVSDPAIQPGWRQRIRENTPGSIRTEAPILVASPEADELVPYASQVSGVAILCRAGDTVDLRTVQGDHASSMWTPYAWEMTESWVHDRFAGRKAVSTCA